MTLSIAAYLLNLLAWPRGGGGGGGVVSYPDPDSHSCGWITSPLRGKRVW